MPTHARARAILESVAKRRILITYQELANALQILPPHSIHRVTEALERLMEEDAAADRPFIAALAISKARGAASSSCSYAAVAITRSIFRKGANFTAARAFEMASTNLVLELSIIKRRHQLRRRVAFILADLIVPPILRIYREDIGRRELEA